MAHIFFCNENLKCKYCVCAVHFVYFKNWSLIKRHLLILLSLLLVFLLLIMYEHFACVYHMYAWCFWRPEEGFRSPRIGVTNGWEPPSRLWGLSPGPLEEEPLSHLSSPKTSVSEDWGYCCPDSTGNRIVVCLVCVWLSGSTMKLLGVK